MSTTAAIIAASAAAAAILPLIPQAVTTINQTIQALRALGFNDAQIKEHITQSEAQLDALAREVLALEIKRHPEDTGA